MSPLRRARAPDASHPTVSHPADRRRARRRARRREDKVGFEFARIALIRLICSQVVHYLRHRFGPWKRRSAGALSPIGGASRPRLARSAGIVRRHDHEPPGFFACRFRMRRAISKYCPAQASAGLVTRGSDKIGATSRPGWTCHRSQESAPIRWCGPPGRCAVGDGAEQPGLAAGTRTRPATHPPIARGIRVPAPPQASRERREPCPDRSPGKPVPPHRRRGVPPGRPARHASPDGAKPKVQP